MTNKEAVNWLINITADIGKTEHRDLWHYEQALTEIKDMLESIQPEPQWIPVSERLPEESEYCIITANDGVGHRTTFAKFQKKAKSWGLTGARSYWRVIAWMPLPKPFEGGTK